MSVDEESKIKVSVIVAVFNAQLYLEKCLTSLVRQTYRHIEIICVDDASTDGSLAILKRFAEQDDRIVVLKNDCNVGASKSRNRAAKCMTGDYVTTLDADDWFSDDALALAVAVLTKHTQTDCVVLDMVRYSQETGEYLHYDIDTHEPLTGEQAFEKTMDWKLHALTVFPASLLRQFPYGDGVIGADDNTSRLHYFYCHNIRFCSGVYYYRQHGESLIHSSRIRRLGYLEANNSFSRQLARLADFPQRDRMLFEDLCWREGVGLYVSYLNDKQRFTAAELYEIDTAFSRWHKSLCREVLPLTLKIKCLWLPVFNYWCFKRWIVLYLSVRRILMRLVEGA